MSGGLYDEARNSGDERLRHEVRRAAAQVCIRLIEWGGRRECDGASVSDRKGEESTFHERPRETSV